MMKVGDTEKLCRLHNSLYKKIPKPFDLGIMAAGEGLEPSQTESESAVLPLHNPAIC